MGLQGNYICPETSSASLPFPWEPGHPSWLCPYSVHRFCHICSSYVLPCVWTGIEICQPLLCPLCPFHFHSSQFFIFFQPPPPLTVKFPLSRLSPSPSPPSIVFSASSTLSFYSPSSRMSAAVLPNQTL